MSKRLVVLSILMCGLLPVSLGAGARCRRPLPDVPVSAEFSAIHKGNVDIYSLAQSAPDQPLKPSKPAVVAPVAAIGGNGRGIRQTPERADGPGGAASADIDGDGLPIPAKPVQATATKVKLADAAPAYAAKSSKPVHVVLDTGQTYRVSAGETLRTALTRWTSGSGWDLVWDAPNDDSLSAAAEVPGGLTEAVTQLMESLRANGAPFGADVWQGNQVIRVTRNR